MLKHYKLQIRVRCLHTAAPGTEIITERRHENYGGV